MDLDALFNHYGSDKTRNGYAPVYHSLFKNLKNNKLSLLEIGIGTMIPGVHSSMVGYSLEGYRPGGSLRAWRDYFPNGEILGADVQPDTQFTEDRIKTILCDSTSSEAVLGSFKDKSFDIIIDDGSHWDENQLKTLRNLYKYVKTGGYYIVEDVYPNSRMSGPFLDEVKKICDDGLLYLTEKKNLIIISKRF